MKTLNTGLVTLAWLSLAMCIPCMRVLAQETIVTYVKENGGHTAHKDSAAYTNIIQITPNDEGVHELNDYYPDGNLKRHGFVKTADPRRINFVGLVESYFDNGALASAVRYVENRPADTALYYYRNGVLKERTTYLPMDEGSEEDHEVRTRMLYYADSLGNTYVEDGNGDAEITIGDSDVERGRYTDGLREGRWEGTFREGRYRFEEWYTRGVVTKGMTTDSLGQQFPYDNQEVSPEYPGGIQNLMQFIGKRYRYPKEAIRARVNGQVLISFVVDTAGAPVEIEIVNDLGYGTGTAGVEVLKKSPHWTPGYQRGVPVRVKYNIPIRLNLSPPPPEKREQS
ncbi:energy transducer TonB [Parapedobacter sp. 10938]|uniref:energy transducer TonB n=1 Tax=Parapedobacter flavus TaxID=3110225 RepID=UPI002DB5ACE7|nr:energy transducer TonB [Parapedobacter sp. 10938]MEC3879436.1 energy transducer TonB [Parapedobacter sp. 10938]